VAVSLGTAYVRVLPTLRGAGTSLNRELSAEIRGVGTRAGTVLGTQMGQGVNSGLSRHLAGAGGRFDELSRRGTTALSNVRTGLGGVGTGFEALDRRSGVAIGNIGKSIDTKLRSPLVGVGKMLGGFAKVGGAALIAAGGAAADMGIKFNAAQEQSQVGFETMLGSAQKAQKFVGDLQKFAAATPFELPGLTSSAQKLLAFGFDAKEVIPTMTAIGDAVAGLGGDAQVLDRVTTTFGQMAAKGRVQSEELLQLTEAGVPAMRLLANQYGVSTGKMQEMVTKGLVPSAKAIPMLLKGMEKGTKGAAGNTTRFAGMMQKQSQTLSGQWSTFKDNFNQAMGNLFKPAMPAIKTALAWLSEHLKDLPKVFAAIRDKVRPIIQGLSRFFTTVLVPAWKNFVLPALRDLWSFITQSVVPAFKTIWEAVKPVVAIFLGAFLVALRVVAAILKNVVGPAFRFLATLIAASWRATRVVITIVWGVLRGIFSAIARTVRWLGGFFTWLYRNAVLPAFNGVRNAIRWAYDKVILPVFNAIKTALGFLGTVFSKIGGAIKTAWEGMGRGIRWVYDNVIKKAFDILKSALTGVKDFFGGIVKGIGIVWGGIKKAAAAPINFVINTIWNDGIRSAWNAITGWIPGLGDKLHLDRLDDISFAHGGVLRGYAPGRDSVRALLSPGEGVLVPEAVRMLGADNVLALNAYASRGRGLGRSGPVFGDDGVPHFFLGGIWDGITNIGKGIANVAKTVVGAVVDAASFIAEFTTNPLGAITSLVPALSGLKRFATSPWGKLITSLPGSIFGGLISQIKAALGFADDGQGGPPPDGAGLPKAKRWAQQQKGKTYLWGAVGPDHYDCSGLVGNLWAIKHNKPMYRRYMTTSAMGAGRFGMESGKGAWTVYLGPGHTAANIGGLDVEAYNGDGTPLAIGRIGTPRSWFTRVLHMAMGGLVKPPRGKRERLESFLVRGWPEPPGAYRFDSGGVVPPGYTTVYNGTRRPEALLSAPQWDAVTRASDGGEFTGQLYLDSGGLLGVVRGEITRANHETARALLRRSR
jgi:tape measure domain-containing protein